MHSFITPFECIRRKLWSEMAVVMCLIVKTKNITWKIKIQLSGRILILFCDMSCSYVWLLTDNLNVSFIGIIKRVNATKIPFLQLLCMFTKWLAINSTNIVLTQLSLPTWYFIHFKDRLPHCVYLDSIIFMSFTLCLGCGEPFFFF